MTKKKKNEAALGVLNAEEAVKKVVLGGGSGIIQQILETAETDSLPLERGPTADVYDKIIEGLPDPGPMEGRIIQFEASPIFYEKEVDGIEAQGYERESIYAATTKEGVRYTIYGSKLVMKEE